MILPKDRQATLRLAIFLLLGVAVSIVAPPALAETGVYQETAVALFQRLSLQAIGFAVAIVVLLLGFIIYKKEETERQKQVIFWTIVVVIAAVTLFVAGSTVYINLTSATGGPVHWHADFKLIGCGQELDLADPVGRLSNKVGTPTLHEHNDNRIHVEGVPYNLEDVSLGRFFDVVGGELTTQSLIVPLADGSRATYQNGGLCPDGAEGEVQVFVYRTDGKVVRQEKLTDPASYIMAPHAVIPPGDCIIAEFGPVKAETDALCRFYDIAIQKGELIPEIAE